MCMHVMVKIRSDECFVDRESIRPLYPLSTQIGSVWGTHDFEKLSVWLVLDVISPPTGDLF